MVPFHVYLGKLTIDYQPHEVLYICRDYFVDLANIISGLLLELLITPKNKYNLLPVEKRLLFVIYLSVYVYFLLKDPMYK